MISKTIGALWRKDEMAAERIEENNQYGRRTVTAAMSNQSSAWRKSVNISSRKTKQTPPRCSIAPALFAAHQCGMAPHYLHCLLYPTRLARTHYERIEEGHDEK